MSEDATQFVRPCGETGQVQPSTLTPTPPHPPRSALLCSPERHYSGRSFLPSLDIIQCNHPSIKNLLVIKGTTRVNTQHIGKDDPAPGDSRQMGLFIKHARPPRCLNRNSTGDGVIIAVAFCIAASGARANMRESDGCANESMG